MTVRFGKAQKAAALVPLAALSAAWTISLTGLGAGSAEATSNTPPTLQDGTVVPAKALSAPATISGPESGTDLSPSKAQQIVASADSSGIPAAALAAYQRASSVIDKADPSCNLSWQLLAAIGRIESNHGRTGGNTLGANGIASPGIYGPELNGGGATTSIADTDGGQFDNDTSFDRAVGPMQFIPSTWSVVGVDADGDGQRNPQDINDAALAAAVYLCSGTDDLATTAGQKAAVFRYNHSQSYVDTVLGVASAYMAGDYSSVPNYTVPAFYFSPSDSSSGSGASTRKHTAKKPHGKGHKTTTTTTTTTTTPTAPPSPAAPHDTTKPTDKTTPKTPVKVPTAGASKAAKAVQDAAASAAELTQVCTQALTKAGASNLSSGAGQQALQSCVSQLTGKTLPQAQQAVTGLVGGLVSSVTGLVGGLLGSK